MLKTSFKSSKTTPFALNCKTLIEEWHPKDIKHAGLQLSKEGIIKTCHIYSQDPHSANSASSTLARENAYVQIFKTFRGFLEDFNSYLDKTSSEIILQCQKAENLYELERAISKFQGLEIQAQFILNRIEEKLEDLDEELGNIDHPQKERMILRCEALIENIQETINQLQNNQKDQLILDEDIIEPVLIPLGPMALVREGARILQFNYMPIGSTPQYGGVEIKARFCSKFEHRDIETHQPAIRPLLEVKMKFREVDQVIKFKLAEFWPESGISALKTILKDGQNQITFLQMILGLPSKLEQKLEKQTYDADYLEHVFTKHNPRQNPSLIMLPKHQWVHTATLQQYTLAHQVVIEWAFRCNFEGVYKVTSPCDVLPSHALGFRQIEDHKELSPSDDSLAILLQERISQGELSLEDLSTAVPPTAHDELNSNRIVCLSTQNLYAKNKFISKDNELSENPEDWVTTLSTKPLLFSNLRWPNIKGLSPCPDIYLTDLLNRQISGKLPPTQQIGLLPLVPENIGNQHELMQLGRFGKQQLKKVVEDSEDETLDKVEYHPNSKDDPQRTWRPFK